MRFSHYMHNAARPPRVVTTRRISMAKRKLDRSREKVGLFPEMSDQRTPQQVCADADASGEAWVQRMRDKEAASWREARAAIRTLRPLQRKGLLRWWQAWNGPGSAVYLLEAIHAATTKHVCYWRKLAELRRFRLVGAGKMAWRRRTEPETQKQISKRRHAENRLVKRFLFFCLYNVRRLANVHAPEGQ